jgi:hypothetical protein
MLLLTTLQVRAIMRANGGKPAYTNKTKGYTGQHRRVKAYYRSNAAMVSALQRACGVENVTVTNRNDPHGFAGVTVKCYIK